MLFPPQLHQEERSLPLQDATTFVGVIDLQRNTSSLPTVLSFTGEILQQSILYQMLALCHGKKAICNCETANGPLIIMLF